MVRKQIQHSHLGFNFHEFSWFLKSFRIKWFQLCVFSRSTYEQKLCYMEIKPTPSLESAPDWECFYFIISRINIFGSIMTQLYPYVYNSAISTSILKQIESTFTIIKCVSRFVKHNHNAIFTKWCQKDGTANINRRCTFYGVKIPSF